MNIFRYLFDPFKTYEYIRIFVQLILHPMNIFGYSFVEKKQYSLHPVTFASLFICSCFQYALFYSLHKPVKSSGGEISFPPGTVSPFSAPTPPHSGSPPRSTYRPSRHDQTQPYSTGLKPTLLLTFNTAC